MLISHSRELDQLNEALKFGHTSLRYHLVLIANLVIRDYLHDNLDQFLNDYVAEFS